MSYARWSTRASEVYVFQSTEDNRYHVWIINNKTGYHDRKKNKSYATIGQTIDALAKLRSDGFGVPIRSFNLLLRDLLEDTKPNKKQKQELSVRLANHRKMLAARYRKFYKKISSQNNT